MVWISMAAAASSALASSEEKKNGVKLSRLLIDGGTTVLRNVFNAYHPPANLAADLSARYSILNKLLRRRILDRHQWDKLFPPGGVNPDSKTFDITLLFLLLSNICGLSPPPTGWHCKPPPSDTSFEGNLARIKFFRNELYGHVSTTGVDTPTFSALWQDVSAVLVALGLSQGEIDRLRAERCGEEDYIDVLSEWAQSEEDVKSQLKDLRQSQTKTQKTVKESKSKLKEVHQIETKTHQVVTEVRQAQHEHLETLQALRETLEDSKGQRDSKHGDEILKKLARVDSRNDVRYYADRYLEGTRASIFSKIKSWLDDPFSPNRVMVISGNAGMGKSVIAAVMCEKMLDAGRLSGSHFCQHDKARHRSARLMLQSLACHLSCHMPEYKKALVKQLSRNLGAEVNNMEVGDLFELLLEEPLSGLSDPGFNSLVVIDALDESEYQGRNDLLDVISRYFARLPRWIRFLMTTRPEINIWDNLKSLHPLLLEPNDEENLADIRLYFEQQLSHVLQAENRELILQGLVQKSEGVILCAHFLVDFIKASFSVFTLEQLHSTSPSDISSVYKSYFKRLETELCKELKITEDQFLTFLSAISAAREPLPLGFVSKLLFSGTLSSAVQRKVNKAIACISSLLPVQDDCVHFFHKSVKDWLVDNLSYGQHNFSVDENEGNQILSRLCIDEFDNVKRKGVDSSQQFSDTTKYALQHGVQHMLQLDQGTRPCSLDEIVDKYVLDIELVYAKLCVDNSTASEDIFSVKIIEKQEGVKTLCVERQNALGTFLFVLRKHSRTIKVFPRAIFQALLNEGGSELSSKASNLLETKYPDIPYMEYLNKNDLHGSVQSKFYCSSEVACFDVSPKSDYMVCECCDGTIQLWSIQTGRLMWKRPVIKRKLYSYNLAAYRTSEPCAFSADFHLLESSQLCNFGLSFFRSVVFHPFKDFILPGVLSHAYAFDGSLTHLFPESECSFSICSISGDNMLSDCPNDAKCLIMWSLTNGTEITRVSRDEDILSFAWSRNGRLLAISHSTGSVCLVDVMSGFRTLAQTTTPNACGMIKFSPDHRFLFCCHFPLRGLNHHVFCVNINMENHENVSLDVSCDSVSYEPWEFESHSEGGFLLGDPLWYLIESSADSERVGTFQATFAFVLNETSMLRSSPRCNFVDLVNLDELKKGRGSRKTIVRNLLFSPNGETVYVVSKEAAQLTAWDISSERLKAEKTTGSEVNSQCCPVAVREGILLTTNVDHLELWNFELSECIRRWTDVRGITAMVASSDEHVICTGWGVSEVIVLDTISGAKVSTISLLGRDLLACDTTCQLLTTMEGHPRSVMLWKGQTVLWKKYGPFDAFCKAMFSPLDQFIAIFKEEALIGEQGLHVLDAVSGNTLHRLCEDEIVLDCKFVSDEECVIHTYDPKSGFLIHLFNVRSGDRLSVLLIDQPIFSLASCRGKGLIAIGFMFSNRKFKVLQVKLQGENNDDRKRKRSVLTCRP